MARAARIYACVLLGVLGATGAVAGQALLDRVLARVETDVITLTDLRVVVGLGLVEGSSGDDETDALERVIDRQLVLLEVARFPPPEPTDAAVADEVAVMRARAGPALGTLLSATGRDDDELAVLARQTLRARAYVAQRFGTAAQVRDEEVRRYYDEHVDEFVRGGARIPFDEVQDEARARAAAERLGVTIADWVADLRQRAEIVRVGS